MMKKARAWMLCIIASVLTETPGWSAPQERAFTYAQAASMSPKALADALLPPGHPIIVAADISDGFGGPGGPPRPGPEYLGAVELTGVAARIGSSAFCSRDEFLISFQDALRSADLPAGTLMRDIPKRPASRRQRNGYYYAGDFHDQAGCGAGVASFESTDADRAAKFALVEQLAAALRLATTSGESLPFRHQCHKIGYRPRNDPFCADGSRALLGRLSLHRITDVGWNVANRQGHVMLDGVRIAITLRRTTDAVVRLDIYDIPVLPG